MTRYHVDAGRAEVLLQRLDAVQRTGGGWRARCPSCGGQSRKLSIAERDGRVLICCFGCGDPAGVLAAVGLAWADIMPPRNWPLSKEEREAARRAARSAAVDGAADVLATEAVVALIASRQVATWRPLSKEDDRRLALAVTRIERAATVLTRRDTFRPEPAPARAVSLLRDAVEALRAELGTTEAALRAAQAVLEAEEQRRAAA